METAREVAAAVGAMAPALVETGRSWIAQARRFRDICWDDLEWRDVLSGLLKSSFEDCAEELADALDGAFLLTFHGCRTEDAGEYHSDGLKVHDRETMAARLQGIVESNPCLAWMKDRLNAAISEIDNEIDVGRLYFAPRRPNRRFDRV